MLRECGSDIPLPEPDFRDDTERALWIDGELQLLAECRQLNHAKAEWIKAGGKK